MELILIALLFPIALVICAAISVFWRIFWYVGAVVLVLALVFEVLKSLF